MRKSRQPRCTAANSMTAAANGLKLLDAGRNLSWVIFGAGSPIPQQRRVAAS
jgi:hypothetical protein